MDLLKGKKVMVWTFMGNTRMYEALRDYGDRMDTVGIFSFKVKDTGEIYESGVAVSTLMPYINKWSHIKWLLTVSNDGLNAVFKALRDNTNGAQDKFLSELIRIMQKYTWCAGIDIDLENGDGYDTHAKSTALFEGVYRTVKGYDSSKRVNICLPGMTSVNGSVGGENWCVYADLDPYCDTASIMSYGMAWAGSAPGPVSPRSWLEGVYDYASTVMNPDKIFLGMPAYGWEWQIYDTPENLGKIYRGTSDTYYAAKNWMLGVYNFTDDGPPQPRIPIIAYWDDDNKVPWALPHVYDYMEGQDAVEITGSQLGGSYNGRKYLTSYAKQQMTEFGEIILERDGLPDNIAGTVSTSNGMCTLGEDGIATFVFMLETEGVYDICAQFCFPFWDKDSVYISIDGIKMQIAEDRLWWPYWRKPFWAGVATGIPMSAGRHTLTISTDSPGVQCYGFKVCTNFSEKPSAGSAAFQFSPRHFKDVNGDMVGPARGFKLTCEMLRRKPDSALIWYEDFRDSPPLPDSYWVTLDGSWNVWRNAETETSRPYSQLDGSGRLAWNYDNLTEIHLRARLAFPVGSGGRAGIFCGDLFCCLNADTQAVELYHGDTLLGSYSTTIIPTADNDLRSNPTMYTVEMRIRGGRVRVYSGASSTQRFTATIDSFTGSYAGYRSDNRTVCELLRLGDAWTYEPYECFDVTYPDGTVVEYGRIQRTNCVWDDEFQVFTLTTNIEESAARTEDISLDYEFYHSPLLPLSCGEDYTVTIRTRIHKGRGLW